MSESQSQVPDGQFRGRIPGTGGPDATPPAAAWGWSPVTDTRPKVSLFGIFLVLFGGLLLFEQLAPGTRVLGSALVVAVGVALVAGWAMNRQIWMLYAGAILTALSLPSLLQDLDIIGPGPGWGTLFLGLALLLIAAIRVGGHGGLGWQAVLGGVLAILGGAQVAEEQIPNFPTLDRLVWPALILIIGLILVLRSTGGRRNLPRV